MMKPKIILTLLGFISFCSFNAPLKPLWKHNMSVDEPSDICPSSIANEFILLADKAFVYKMDQNGNIVSRLDFIGYDLEAVCADEQHYYISEETFKEIYQIRKSDFVLEKTIPVQHGGGRNEGIEAMVYFPDSKKFILATEKGPQTMMEMDQSMSLISTFSIEGISEVSAMALYKGKWFVLSDEASTLYEVDFTTKKIRAQYWLPIINPEGISFTSEGKLLVVSDDMAKIFLFEIPVQ
jgi:uncharacterized protein YjiK